MEAKPNLQDDVIPNISTAPQSVENSIPPIQSIGNNIVEKNPVEEIAVKKKRTKVRDAIKNSYFQCRVWFSFAYILEWILSLLLIVIAEVFFGTYFGIVPINKRYGPLLNDPFVQFPIVPELTPPAVLLTIPIFVPIGVALIINLIYLRSLHDFHHYCLGLLESMSVTWIITNILKIITGRPRVCTKKFFFVLFQVIIAQ